MFSSRCATEPVPGIGTMAAERGEQPRQHDLRGGRAVPGRRAPAPPVGLGVLDRCPRQERDRLLLTQVEQRLRVTVGQVVAVLDRDDRGRRLRDAQLRLVDVRQTDVPDLALRLQLDERADRVLVGHLRVGSVELVEGDLLEPEPAEAVVTHLTQMVGVRVRRPPAGTGALEAAFCRDHQVGGVRVQRLGDELLAHRRPVGVGGVDEVDAQLDGAPQHGLRHLAVGRVAPDAGAGDAHRAEAEAAHGEVTTDVDRARVHRQRGSSAGSMSSPASIRPVSPMSK